MERKSRFKLSLIFLLAAAPTIALAQPNCPVCTFSGWTVGLGAGATTFMTHGSSDTTITSDLATFTTPGDLFAAPNTSGNSWNLNAADHVHKYGAMGSLFLGYGWAFDNHSYVGAELGVNGMGANTTTLNQNSANNATMSTTDGVFSQFGTATYNNSLSTKTTVRRNSLEPFLDLKLGFLMTPTAMAYLRGGINYNTIKLKTTGNYNVFGTEFYVDNISHATHTRTASTSSGFSNSKSKSEIGYRAGIGTEILITPEFSVSADYVYSFYRNVKLNTSESISDLSCDTFEGCKVVPANVTNNSKATNINDQQVLARLIYHFG